MECHCHLRNIPDLMFDGKTPYGRLFGVLFNGPVIPTASIPFWNLVKNIFWMCVAHGRRGVWKRDIFLSQALKNWERWTHLNSIHVKRLNAKEVVTPNRTSLHSQSRMEQSNFLEEIKIWEHPPWSGTAQTEEKNMVIFKENQKGFLQHNFETHQENQTGFLQPHFEIHRGMMVKLEMITGSFPTKKPTFLFSTVQCWTDILKNLGTFIF